MKWRFAACVTISTLLLWMMGTHLADASGVHTSNEYLDRADMRIGKLIIGQTLHDVGCLYGNPTAKTNAHGAPDPRWVYRRQGFSVNGKFGVKGNPVWQIQVTKTDVGSTRRGIHVGSSERLLRRVYPHLRVLEPNRFYEEVDSPYAVDFTVVKGIVTEVTITDLHP